MKTTDRLPPKRSEPLGAPDAFNRICDLRDGREARRFAALAAFDASEEAAEKQLRERVPAEQRQRLDVMFTAFPEAMKLAEEAVARREAEAKTLTETATEAEQAGLDDCRPPLTTTGDTSKPLESWKDSEDNPSEKTTDDVLDIAPTEATTKALAVEPVTRKRRAAATAVAK